MNQRLVAALRHTVEDAGQRRSLLSLRHEAWSVQERLEVAQHLSAKGAHRAAALWLASALRQTPEAEQPGIAYRLGNALRLARHERSAAAVLDAVCATCPSWDKPAHSLAWLHRNAGRSECAVEVMERWLGAIELTPDAAFRGAGFLADMRQVERAERLLARVIAPPPALQAERANLLLQMGHFEQAEQLLLRSLERDPTQGGVWMRLALVKRWTRLEDSPLESMQQACDRADLDDLMRAAIGFALVKVNDDLGRYEAAWNLAEEANALRAGTTHFDRSAWMRFEEYIYQVFNKDFFKENEIFGDSAIAPVFVVGMPRSGTTLIERRLGRHSLLLAAGELEVIESLGLELTGPDAYPHRLATLPPQAFSDAARQWRQRLPAEDKPGSDVIDKNPLNFMHLGLISRLFPRARIVHCRRDPLDTALSLWFQNFAHPRGDYSYRMDDLAWMYGFYRRVMRWWERVLPLPVHHVDYERVVAEPERELRALVTRLGLEWQPAMLEAPAAGEGSISTASMWQARQPLYRSAAGRARNYEPWIGGLREALRRAGV